MSLNTFTLLHNDLLAVLQVETLLRLLNLHTVEVVILLIIRIAIGNGLDTSELTTSEANHEAVLSITLVGLEGITLRAVETDLLASEQVNQHYLGINLSVECDGIGTLLAEVFTSPLAIGRSLIAYLVSATE